jgi:NAD(P)-dependent dehydrogenase (short-subunit alcohol dehydrogenase family)
MKDPRNIYPKPPFNTPKLDFPGLEKDVTPPPDFGEGTYKGSGKLEGRKALITGGDSGIGRAVAYAFACEGADVAINYLPEEEEDALVVKAAVEKVGRKIVCIPGDIRTEDACQQIAKKAVDELGGIDILINNAAYQMNMPELEDMTMEQLERTYHTNLFPMFFFVKALMSQFKPGSSIINTTSIQGYKPDPELLPYATSKAAIIAFTQALSKKVIEKGIRVNGVAPGPIWSPLNPMAMPKERVEKFGAHTLMGRPGQPVEVAKVFVFLASDDASYVTGHIYGVTGGMEMPA